MRANSDFLVGDGKRVGFWEDAWCDQNPLCITFPALYSIANSKGAKVAEVWDSMGEGGGWNPRFGRGFNDWELDMVQDFIATVQNKKISPTVEDILVW